MNSIEQAYVSLSAEVRSFVARRVPADAVDDLSQEIFVRLREHASELRDASRTAPWLFRIARSVVVDHLRKRRPHELLDPSSEPPAEEAEVNLNEEMTRSFRALLSHLPDEYREALELVEMQGKSQKELAALTGLSLSGAKSRVQRARKMFEDLIRACCDFETDRRGNVLACSPRTNRSCSSC